MGPGFVSFSGKGGGGASTLSMAASGPDGFRPLAIVSVFQVKSVCCKSMNFEVAAHLKISRNNQ